LTYGIEKPTLYFIALLSYFILYSIERILIACFFQLPPTFDESMTKNAIKILRWAAVFYLAFGY
jgi:hypothetical protein